MRVPSRNTLLLGGGGIAALLAAYWLGRRMAKPQLGDGSGSSTVDFILQMPVYGKAAALQVAKATAGSWLTDYRQAEDISRFFYAPAYDVQAHYHAAYWMAVAARLLHSRTLASLAAGAAAKGAALFSVPFSSWRTDGAQEIMSDARSTVSSYAEGNKLVSPVLAAMRTSGSAASIAIAKQRTGDQSWVSEGAKRTAEDAAKMLPKPPDPDAFTPGDYIRAFLGLSDPRTGKPYSALMRYGTRTGVAVTVAGAGYLYFRAGRPSVVVVTAPSVPEKKDV